MGYSSDNPTCQGWGLQVFFASCECSGGWQGTPQHRSNRTAGTHGWSAEILLENCRYLWCGLTESSLIWSANTKPEITYRRQVVLAGVASCSTWWVLLCLQCWDCGGTKGRDLRDSHPCDLILLPGLSRVEQSTAGRYRSVFVPVV